MAEIIDFPGAQKTGYTSEHEKRLDAWFKHAIPFKTAVFEFPPGELLDQADFKNRYKALCHEHLNSILDSFDFEIIKFNNPEDPSMVTFFNTHMGTDDLVRLNYILKQLVNALSSKIDREIDLEIKHGGVEIGEFGLVNRLDEKKEGGGENLEIGPDVYLEKEETKIIQEQKSQLAGKKILNYFKAFFQKNLKFLK